MKLRNKKTGEIIDLARRGLLKSDNDNHIIVYPEGALKYYAYNSLAELNAEWEDYKPAGPLIEKRSHRGVLRAAAQMSGTSKVHVCKSDWAEVVLFEFNGKEICSVELKDKGIHTDHDGWYTIVELCGEEEE